MKVTDVEVRWVCKRCKARGLVWGSSLAQARVRLAVEKAQHKGCKRGKH